MPFSKGNIVRRLRNLRENINIFLYDSKTVATRILNVLSVLAALAGIAGLVLAYGFENGPRTQEAIRYTFSAIIVFYYVKFIAGYLYSFTPRKYFSEYRINGILLGVLLCVFIYRAFTPTLLTDVFSVLGVHDPRLFSAIVEQLAFLTLLVIEIGRASSFLPSTQLSAQKLFVLSFMFLILAGSVLLMLPQMTAPGVTLSFTDALFTSTSASCVTGLSTVDIGNTFSLRGQIVIMLLVQFGGLNIITFATFFLILSKRSIGISNQALIKDSLEAKNFKESIFLLKDIFYFTLVIETVGAVLIFFNWSNNTPFIDVYQKAYYSIFHSIASFNNAGFSLFDQGLFNYYCRNAYVLQFIIAVLIILGGIGFPVIKNIVESLKKKGNLRVKWSLNTRIVVFTSLVLIGVGMLSFLAFEWNASLKDQPVAGKLVASFFQSVSARTAGFQTVDFSVMLNPTLIMMMVMMFIGASPVSTGGGIKTTTLFVLLLSAVNTVRGKQRINIEHSEIGNGFVLRAMTILLFSALFVILGTMVLSFTDPDKPVMALVFEEMSAFTTTGLSVGITPDMSVAGKVTLIVSMFMGRIGLLTFGFALLNRMRPEPDYKYPEAHVIIG